ncbi:MAG: hypothetical protein K1X61_11735 [Chitinophagales bacterium]|nr:hypothetical protein [Chitinophagales bacterium]
MGFNSKADIPEGNCFATSKIVQWIDLFTRKKLLEVVIDSLHYCNREGVTILNGSYHN